MNDNSKTIVALLAGLAAGAALGLLFAPEVGSATRDKIAESLNSLGNSIRDIATEQVDKLTGALSETAVAGKDALADDLEHA